MAGTLGRGGAERQLLYSLSSLKNSSVTTRVLCLTNSEPLEDGIRNLGVPVSWVGSSPSHLLRLAKVVQSVRHQPADIVQAVHFYTNIYVALAARICGATSIGAIRSDLASELIGSRATGQAQLRLPHYLIANSRLARERALAMGRSPERVLLVENAVNREEFPYQQSSHRPTSREVRMLFVGRLVSEKRCDRFLRLASALGRSLQDRRIEARIVGNGPQMGALRLLHRGLGLSSSDVQFLGEVEDMGPAYRWADFLVLTSDHEGTPNVVLEAMSCGVPVISTAVGGVPDLLGSGRGLLVLPDDEATLADAASRLAQDAGLREQLSVRAHDYVTSHYSLETLRARLESVYTDALCQRR